MPQLLPRFRRSQERIDDQRRIAEAILEGEDLAFGLNGGGVLRRSADGPDRLRGLPAIGQNVSGATRHTDPVRALLAKANRRRRKQSLPEPLPD